MEENKKWWESKGVWGGVLAVVGGLLGVGGYVLGPEDIETLSAAFASIGSAVGGILAVYGRVKASKKVAK